MCVCAISGLTWERAGQAARVQIEVLELRKGGTPHSGNCPAKVDVIRQFQQLQRRQPTAGPNPGGEDPSQVQVVAADVDNRAVVTRWDGAFESVAAGHSGPVTVAWGGPVISRRVTPGPTSRCCIQSLEGAALLMNGWGGRGRGQSRSNAWQATLCVSPCLRHAPTPSFPNAHNTHNGIVARETVHTHLCKRRWRSGPGNGQIRLDGSK